MGREQPHLPTHGVESLGATAPQYHDDHEARMRSDCKEDRKASKDVERRWANEMGITLALRRARMAKRICPAIKDARGRYCVDGELGENVLTLSTCWEEVAEEDEATEE